MDLSEHLEIKKGVCEYRPCGKSTLVEAVTLITSAIAYCRRQKIGKLLVDATGLDDVPIPTLVDRFLMVEEWAEASESLVVWALVVREEYIHPQKFGVHVAVEFGLQIDIFTSEAEAIAWLSLARDPRSPAEHTA